MRVCLCVCVCICYGSGVDHLINRLELISKHVAVHVSTSCSMQQRAGAGEPEVPGAVVRCGRWAASWIS